MSTDLTATCTRCECQYSYSIMGGHTPDLCIASLKKQNRSLRRLITKQKEITSEYVSKWFSLFITEIKHDMDEGVLFKEDLEPYLSEIAALIRREP